MNITRVQQQLLREGIRGVVRFDEPMKLHTTMQVGGPADVWIEPADREDLPAALAIVNAEGFPWYCVGRGSNLLVRDGGIRGAVFHLGALDALRVEQTVGRGTWDVGREGNADSSDILATQGSGRPTSYVLYADAGVKLKRLLGFCAEHGLSGLEGLEGIPGTVGGAVVMNAGTPAGCMGDSIVDVQWLDKTGRIVTRTAEQLELGYRKAKVPRGAVIICARLRVAKSTPDAVREKLRTLREVRSKVQPGTQPSVGSVFRNPSGMSAWKLIQETGLQGVRIGRARVSEQHANWIVNEGGATARDVEVLVRLIRDKVKDATGILLEPEVVIVGEEG